MQHIEEKAQEMLQIVEKFINLQEELSELSVKIDIDKLNLFNQIKEYVFKINADLFNWINLTNKLLSDNGIGNIKIDIREEQSHLFPEKRYEFIKYNPKEFSYIIGDFNFYIKSEDYFTLHAEILFMGLHGKFIWKDNESELFYSGRHLASRDERFGKFDFLDLFSMLGSHGSVKDLNGEYRIIRDPIKIISEKIISQMDLIINKIPKN